MRKFELHNYSGMAYDDAQTIAFARDEAVTLPDLHEKMKHCTGISSVQVSCLTQEVFDEFVNQYGDTFESIYFFQNPKVRDLSALSRLKKVKYLLFYNVRGQALWDMRGNAHLKGIMIHSSKKMLYDLEQLPSAPELEELILLSSMSQKYPVKTTAPLANCRKLKRLFMDFNTEDKGFCPEDFGFLDVFQYSCDRKRNFTY